MLFIQVKTATFRVLDIFEMIPSLQKHVEVDCENLGGVQAENKLCDYLKLPAYDKCIWCYA